MKKFTHEGIMEGIDARTPANFKRKVELRETKLYWNSASNLKFSKRGGRTSGDWSMYRLDLESVNPI